ncbi:MFS transporter [Porticoccaceae bacterium]|nr:MFS transporter [Porticoccaceae bacterium]
MSTILGTQLLMMPMAVVQGIYAKYYGVALTSIALVLLFSRLLDAITDPLVGYFSDRSRARTGSRKPYIVSGGLGCAVCGYFLYVPPDEVGIAYFATWMCLFYLAFTVYFIPFLAWSRELTQSSTERAWLFSLMSASQQLSGVIFFLVPFLPIFASPEITPKTLEVIALVGVLLMLVTIVWAVRNVPNGSVGGAGQDYHQTSFKNFVAEFFLLIRRNPPYRLFLVAFGLIELGLGMFLGLDFIYIDIYLGLGEQYATMSLIALVFILAIIPICYRLIALWGNRNTWMLASASFFIGLLYVGSLTPNEAGLTQLLIVRFFYMIGFGFVNIVVLSVISEAVDYGEWVENTNKSGMYFSIYSFFIKTQLALGAALSLAMAGWFGFDATASTQSETAVLGLRLAIAWIPAFLVVVGTIFVWLTPLNERRNRIVRRRLDQRAAAYKREQELRGQEVLAI